MGTFKKKKIILMSIADLTIGCTTSVKCTTADACCAKFTAVTATANVSPVAASPDICIPVGSKIAAQTGIVDGKQTTGGKGCPVADCVKSTTGASALAVSAVAAATAVYMM